MLNSHSNANLLLDKAVLPTSQRDESLQHMAKRVVRKKKRARGSKDHYGDSSRMYAAFQSRKLEPSDSAISLLSNLQNYAQAAHSPPVRSSIEKAYVPEEKNQLTLNARSSENKLLL